MSKPVAELPKGITRSASGFSGTVMDTAYTEPDGREWACHTVQEFREALIDSQLGDVIVLDPGVTYSGNFVVPGKVQQGETQRWLHITTAGFHETHMEGLRVTPNDAVNMARIESPNVSQALAFVSGDPRACNIRISGIEFRSQSNYRPEGYTSGVYYGYALIGIQGAWQDWAYTSLPKDIVFDRVYVHGDDTHDLQCGIQCNFERFALLDSWISEIHMKGTDTTACGGFCTPGPIKMTNDYLEAAGENVIFGGSGGNVNPLTCDIEIQDCWLFKPLEWVPLSLAPLNQYTVKNSFELKSAQRVLFNHNEIANCWAAAQLGYCVVLTTRSGQSGDIAVVNDVTITNNVCRNVTAFVNSLSMDDTCGPPSYPNCKCAGEGRRWEISNNLVTHYDPTIPGGNRNLMLAINGGMDRINSVMGVLHDVVFEHNTQVPAASAPPWQAIWVSCGAPPEGFTREAPPGSNVWIHDNVLSRQLTGDNGWTGTRALETYLGEAEPYEEFQGNVMQSQGSPAANWPASNTVPAAITFVDAENGDYTLLEPAWTETADGSLAGVDMTRLPGQKGEVTPPEEVLMGIRFQLNCYTRVNVDGEPTVEVTVIPESVRYE